ncbi:MAG: anti-sigma factor [Rhodopila sp.]|nr:anti-sigma factor [Rhodopila sp.]
MSEVTPPVNEDDLHAYVDGQLEAGRRSAVERYLEENLEAARRVTAYQEQREAIRAAFAARSSESLPPALSLVRVIEQWNRRPRQRWLVAASVLLALGIGLAGGWLLRTAPAPGGAQQALALLGQEALSSHVVYAVDLRHPVEVPGTEAPHLQQWLSNRLDRIVVAPDLSALGYHLVGGRLLATERGGAAALLMYDDANRHRISVLLRPMTPTLHAPAAMIRKDGVNGQAWIANGLGIAVVSAMPESDITPLAAQIGTDLHTPG